MKLAEPLKIKRDLTNYNIDIVKIKMVKESDAPYRVSVPSPRGFADLIRNIIDDSDKEMFVVVCLDTKNKPTCINVASIGTLSTTVVHPREVFKTAILANSASIIIAHNHPSGDTTPSQEDITVTKRLIEAGKVLGIDVLDHLILGEDGEYLSFKEKCYM